MPQPHFGVTLTTRPWFVGWIAIATWLVFVNSAAAEPTLYWSDQGDVGSILRTTLDGTEVTVRDASGYRYPTLLLHCDDELQRQILNLKLERSSDTMD